MGRPLPDDDETEKQPPAPDGVYQARDASTDSDDAASAEAHPPKAGAGAARTEDGFVFSSRADFVGLPSLPSVVLGEVGEAAAVSAEPSAAQSDAQRARAETGAPKTPEGAKHDDDDDEDGQLDSMLLSGALTASLRFDDPWLKTADLSLSDLSDAFASGREQGRRDLPTAAGSERQNPSSTGESVDGAKTVVEATTDSTEVILGPPTLPKEDAALRKQRAQQERALVHAMYDTERAFETLKEEDPARAARIHKLASILEPTAPFKDRETVLRYHAEKKRELFRLWKRAPKKPQPEKEDELLATALLTRLLDDAYRNETNALRDELTKDIDNKNPRHALLLADFAEFAATDEAADVSFCRRELHRALRNDDRRRAQLLSLALKKTEPRRR